jgi:hypothetical protein
LYWNTVETKTISNKNYKEGFEYNAPFFISLCILKSTIKVNILAKYFTLFIRAGKNSLHHKQLNVLKYLEAESSPYNRPQGPRGGAEI